MNDTCISSCIQSCQGPVGAQVNNIGMAVLAVMVIVVVLIVFWQLIRGHEGPL